MGKKEQIYRVRWAAGDRDFKSEEAASIFRSILQDLEIDSSPVLDSFKRAKFVSRPLTLAEMAAEACTCDGGGAKCRACCAEKRLKDLAGAPI